MEERNKARKNRRHFEKLVNWGEEECILEEGDGMMEEWLGRRSQRLENQEDQMVPDWLY